MGGFTRLKDDFDRYIKILEQDVTEKRDDAQRQAIFRYLYLRSLFEINGNLDSIALCSSALVEQLEKIAIVEKAALQIATDSLTVQHAVVKEQQKSQEVFLKANADLLQRLKAVDPLPDPRAVADPKKKRGAI